MASVQELVASLSRKFPEEAEDLQRALEALLKQKLSSCDRLAKLNDNQWQRLELPLGIEALLREAAATAAAPAATAAPAAAERPVAHPGPEPALSRSTARARKAPADEGEIPLEDWEPEVPPEGSFRQRRGSRVLQAEQRGSSSFSKPVVLKPPADLDVIWQELMEESLPPDKRACLQEAFDRAANDQERYMMYLEYSSYFRRPEVTPAQRAEQRKQLEPLMRELGINLGPDGDEEGKASVVMWLLLICLIAGLLGVVRYFFDHPHFHDGQSL